MFIGLLLVVYSALFFIIWFQIFSQIITSLFVNILIIINSK